MPTNLNQRIFKFFFFLIFFIGSSSFAQPEKFIYNGHSIELDKRVIEHYGLEYVTELKTNNPDLLLYLNYFVENAYRIEDIGEKAFNPEIQSIASLGKSEKSKAPAFNPSDLSSFNILAYIIQLTSEQQVFKVGSDSKAIIVLSKQYFLEKYNAYRNTIIK